MTNEILNSLRGLRLKQFVRTELEDLSLYEPRGYDEEWSNGFIEGQIIAYPRVFLRLMNEEEAAEAERVRFEMFGTPR